MKKYEITELELDEIETNVELMQGGVRLDEAEDLLMDIFNIIDKVKGLI